MPVIIALSSVEAEYIRDCNLGTMISQLQELQYEFEYLGTPEYKFYEFFGPISTMLLIDNQVTVQMSKNYRVTSKNRHIGPRCHFVQ
jgi:hypothetical protein